MPDGQRVNVTLDEQRAAKLSRLAARMHVAEGTPARSLLSSAIDDADPDPDNVAALLGTIPSVRPCPAGPATSRRGDTIPLADL